MSDDLAEVFAGLEPGQAPRQRKRQPPESVPTPPLEPEPLSAIMLPEVDIADLGTATPAEQQWYWGHWVPAGQVTICSGHGGGGKTTVGAQLGVCIADGRECFGHPTKQGNVAIFSAEDSGPQMRRLIGKICRRLGVDPAHLAKRLRVIDASEIDSALYIEQRAHGVRIGTTTLTYELLRDFVISNEIDVLIIDNASDVFDADEINRQMVRGFMRSLAQLVRHRGGAVILLAHVDKATSRAGKQAGGEAYSGSTAWHNSARSRLFLVEKAEGVLELQHLKSNLGLKMPPLELAWPAGGLPERIDTSPAAERVSFDDTRELLRLLVEFNGRNEWVSPSIQSRSSASRLFAREPTYPRHLKPGEVDQLLRDAERRGLVSRLDYRTTARKQATRWEVTALGFAAIGGDGPLFGAGAR